MNGGVHGRGLFRRGTRGRGGVSFAALLLRKAWLPNAVGLGRSGLCGLDYGEEVANSLAKPFVVGQVIFGVRG